MNCPICNTKMYPLMAQPRISYGIITFKCSNCKSQVTIESNNIDKLQELIGDMGECLNIGRRD